MSKKVVLNDFSIDVPDELSVDEIREMVAPMRPEITNADATEQEDGTVRFDTVHGTKG